MSQPYEVKLVSVTDCTYPVMVAVGDGSVVFDDKFPMDERIFFYFHDAAEFEAAKADEVNPDFGFRIIREVPDYLWRLSPAASSN